MRLLNMCSNLWPHKLAKTKDKICCLTGTQINAVIIINEHLIGRVASVSENKLWNREIRQVFF